MEGKVLLEKANFKAVSTDLAFESAKVLIVDGFIYLYGSVQLLKGKKKGFIPGDKAKKLPYIFKLNKKGEVIKEIKFADITLEKLGNLSYNKEDQLMLTGSLSQKESGKYFFLRIPTTLDKELLVLEKFDNEGVNEGVDLIALEGGEVLLLGNNKRKGARTFDVFLNKVDRYGKPKWETPWFHGSKYEEKGIQLLQKEDQSLWVCGIKDDGKGFKSDFNFWFLCIDKAKKVKQTTRALNQVVVTSKQKQTSFSLNKANQLSLSYQIQNKSQLTKVKLQMVCLNCPSKLEFEKEQQIVNLKPASDKTINLTIAAGKKINYGLNTLVINFLNTANQVVFEETVEVQIKDMEKQPFDLVKTTFESQGNNNIISNKKETVLLVEVENKSKRTYKQVKLKFEEQEDMTMLSFNFFEEKEWKAGEKKKFKIKFIPDKVIPISRFSMEAFILFGKNSRHICPLVIKPKELKNKI